MAFSLRETLAGFSSAKFEKRLLFMAGEDPRATARLDLPQTRWKTVRERKPIKEETKVPSDDNEGLGQKKEAPKQGLSTIWQLSNLSLGVCPRIAVANPLLS